MQSNTELGPWLGPLNFAVGWVLQQRNVQPVYTHYATLGRVLHQINMQLVDTHYAVVMQPLVAHCNKEMCIYGVGLEGFKSRANASLFA